MARLTMTRPAASTTARGYGSPHQSLRAQRLAAYQPGDPCAIGGEPLPWPRAQAAANLDLPHDHVNGGYLPGLSCRAHNRADGGSRGGKARARQLRPSRPFTTSRAW